MVNVRDQCVDSKVYICLQNGAAVVVNLWDNHFKPSHLPSSMEVRDISQVTSIKLLDKNNIKE